MVVSENGVLENLATALASYYDTLLTNAFGNYRTLLEAVTLTPAMGLYLNLQGNSAGSIITASTRIKLRAGVNSFLDRF